MYLYDLYIYTSQYWIQGGGGGGGGGLQLEAVI